MLYFISDPTYYNYSYFILLFKFFVSFFDFIIIMCLWKNFVKKRYYIRSDYLCLFSLFPRLKNYKTERKLFIVMKHYGTKTFHKSEALPDKIHYEKGFLQICIHIKRNVLGHTKMHAMIHMEKHIDFQLFNPLVRDTLFTSSFISNSIA